jgi:hypothetical protein
MIEHRDPDFEDAVLPSAAVAVLQQRLREKCLAEDLRVLTERVRAQVAAIEKSKKVSPGTMSIEITV